MILYMVAEEHSFEGRSLLVLVDHEFYFALCYCVRLLTRSQRTKTTFQRISCKIQRDYVNSSRNGGRGSYI